MMANTLSDCREQIADAINSALLAYAAGEIESAVYADPSKDTSQLQRLITDSPWLAARIADSITLLANSTE